MYISINCEFIQEEKALVSVSSEGFLYGYGVFETIKFDNKKIFFLKEHLERLKDGCYTLKLSLDYDTLFIQDHCNKLIAANNLKSGVLRILYAKNKNRNDLIISVRENKYKDEDYKKGFKLCFTDIKRNPYTPLTYIKSNNYVENLIARQGATERGYDEVIFLNIYEKICEGSMTNIFFVKDGTIHTPSIDCGLLPGIIRNKVIDIIDKLNLKFQIGEYTKEELLEADEIFLTNSLLEIMPVSQIEDKKLDLEKNFITKMLKDQYGFL
ncbi:MAG: aminotransferase class IV [Firmicutes bacterium]|nr:aminotransferase class IV [Bacillota bacterium]